MHYVRHPRNQSAVSEPQTQRSWFTEGVLLAGMSAYAYLLAFLYEYGYCAHFDIPTTFIAPSLSTILVAAAALAAALVPALYVLAFTTPLFKAARDPNRRPFRDVFAFSAVLFAAGILLGAIYGYTLRGAVTYVVVAVLFMLFLFLPAVLSNRHLPIRDRFAQHADLQDQDPFLVTNLLESWMTRKQVLLVMAGLLTLGLALLVGDAEATRKVNFLTLKGEPDVAVVRNYGDLIIGAKFDGKSKETTGEFRFLWVSDKKEVSFVLAPVGPLKPKAAVSFKASSSSPSPTGKPASVP